MHCAGIIQHFFLCKTPNVFKISILEVHKHEIFFSFFAETKFLWSQGLATRDFLSNKFDLAEILEFLTFQRLLTFTLVDN